MSLFLFILTEDFAKKKFKFDLSDIFFIIFLVFAVLSYSSAICKYDWWNSFPSIFSGMCIYFYARLKADDVKFTQLFLPILLASTVTAVAYGLYQKFYYLDVQKEYILSHPELLKEIAEDTRQEFFWRLDEVKSTFINSNLFSSFVASMFFVFTAYFIKIKTKIFSLAFITLILIFIILTLHLADSLGAQISFLISLVLCFLLYRTVFKKSSIELIFLVIVCVIGFVYLWHSGYLQKTIENSKGSTGVRYRYNLSAIKVVKEKPLLGVGLGNFHNLYYKYMLEDAQEVQNTHNDYLNMMCEVGLIGGSAFLIFWLMKILLSILSLKKKNTGSNEMNYSTEEKKTYFTFGLIAFIFILIFGYSVSRIFVGIDSSHSFLIFSIFIWLITFTFFFYNQKQSTENNEQYFNLFILCALINMLIHSLGDIDFYISANASLIWFFAGFLSGKLNLPLTFSLNLKANVYKIFSLCVIFLLIVYIFARLVPWMESETVVEEVKNTKTISEKEYNTLLDELMEATKNSISPEAYRQRAFFKHRLCKINVSEIKDYTGKIKDLLDFLFKINRECLDEINKAIYFSPTSHGLYYVKGEMIIEHIKILDEVRSSDVGGFKMIDEEKLRQMNLAKNTYLKAVEYCPVNVHNKYKLGLIQFNFGEYQEAKKNLEFSLRVSKIVFIKRMALKNEEKKKAEEILKILDVPKEFDGK